MLKKTVVVGLSGGVDSSVAAYLLKREGYQVIGLFMKNWDQPVQETKGCSAQEDFEDVVRVCKTLDIPYYSVNFVKEYQEHVFKEFLIGYEKGFTPNPDILCNREIKFKHFYNKAKELGADYLATGHYARICSFNSAPHELHKAKDPNKDQSYFLYTLKTSLLPQLLFPLGGLEKKQVRCIAQEQGLCVSQKKDSTGICFIGEKKFAPFLKRYLRERPGELQRLSGDCVGLHHGLPYYTIGQRKGLGLGGEGAPWYVVGKDISRNIVYVERGEHPALYCDELYVDEMSWIDEKSAETFYQKPLEAKVRYRQQVQRATLYKDKKGYRVVFEIPQRAIAPMQSVVLYDGDRCLGGGIIRARGDTYFEKKKALPLAVAT